MHAIVHLLMAVRAQQHALAKLALHIGPPHASRDREVFLDRVRVVEDQGRQAPVVGAYPALAPKQRHCAYLEIPTLNGPVRPPAPKLICVHGRNKRPDEWISDARNLARPLSPGYRWDMSKIRVVIEFEVPDETPARDLAGSLSEIKWCARHLPWTAHVGVCLGNERHRQVVRARGHRGDRRDDSVCLEALATEPRGPTDSPVSFGT